MKPQLIDPFGRKIEYLRLSVTDKCNLRCFYCLPKGFNDFDDKSLLLTQDEILRIVTAFAELGVRRVRITGGEPLVRKDLHELTTRLSDIPEIEDLSLSTNASLLIQQAEELKAAGISRINVSLDTLRKDRFNKINGGQLTEALNGLMAAKKAGFSPIKINMVAMKGINDDEFEDMVAFCLQHDFTLRFIETMPVSSAGRKGSQYYLPLQEVEKKLKRQFKMIDSVMPGGGPARYCQISGTKLRIGFITPISQHFCETCNRVRLTATGALYLCLGNEHKIELREQLRDGMSDEALKQCLVEALNLKPERHYFEEKPDQIVRFMSKIGG